MVNADEYYGEYLKADDIAGREVEATISSVCVETLDGDEKLIVDFHELSKRLVLNKTNKDRIKEVTGTAETDDWIGKKIVLCSETVQYRGEEVPAVRVKLKPLGG